MSKFTVKKRHVIRKSQIARLLDRLAEEIGPSAELFRSDRIERVETDAPVGIYLVDKKPLLMAADTWTFPTLRGLVEHPIPERRVVVDTGAVRFVANGADAMRPGIVSISPDIRAGRPVQVVEERHGKPLAVGIALFDAADMEQQEKGKSVRSIHHVGDDIWNLEI
ncbi:RNA-binding protein [Methanoculleus bourgensis MS2]|jgi:PUA-domain protein|uniref:RNA-binding protein n=2 Tax=Methanoculleus bourgensis TaxID=83986 RepID=I7J736_METBM|nr:MULTISPECIES: RNA-binding protein [Methanoculleus]MDD3372888.1 RNA-binding protein [Methanoculleus bourgensis]CCJ35033.1 RNA-binding protein [Methanoculleus bourgensis MS2]CVK31372.1 RNA-binding protein [Methanoculleus bourgensis]SAI87063.1 RNA-binding protein [Methanoculleus bourgensis]GLI45459.1 RNA-binding protein [Methanoculleus bourgensis]